MDRGSSTSVREKGVNQGQDGHGHSSGSQHQEHTVRYNPVDTGWSWVILSALFVIQFISVGLMRSLGVLFVAIQMRFQTSASMLALLGSVESACFSLSGLLSISLLLEVMTVRRCTLIGAAIGVCGLVLSSLVTNVPQLIATFAVCSGLGKGLAMPPGFVLLNVYFRQQLPLATGISNCGASVGSLVMPIVTQLFLEQYFLSGTFLLLGGLFAQILVAGALYTPPSDYQPRKAEQPSRAVSRSKDMMPIEQQRLLAGELNGRRSVSEMTLETVLMSRDSTDVDTQLTKSLQTIDGQQIRHRHHRPSYSEHQDSATDVKSLDLVMVSSMYGSHAVSLASLNLEVNVTEADPAEFEELVHGRTDEQGDSDEDSSREGRHRSGCNMSCEKLGATFDPSLLRSVGFWLLAVYHYTGSMVSGLASAYLPALAQEKGLSVTQGAMLMAIAGGLDMVSRLVPGLLAQCALVRPRVSAALSLLLVGLVFQFTALTDSLPAMVCVAVLYGLFSGVFFSMIPLIIIDFSDRDDKFRQVFGMAQLAMGVSGVTGYPIIGYMKDLSGSYVTSFHFMGACALLASLILVVLSALQAHETRKRLPDSWQNRQQDELQHTP